MSWQLGNIYLFEEAAGEPEVLLLYMLGPNYCGNLDVDLSMFQTYDIINKDTVKVFSKGSALSPVVPVEVTKASGVRSDTPSSVESGGEAVSGNTAVLPEKGDEYESSDVSTRNHVQDVGLNVDENQGITPNHFMSGSDDIINCTSNYSASLLLAPSSYNEQMSRLDDKIVFLFSARNMVLAQSFRVDGFGSARAPHQHHVTTTSLAEQENSQNNPPVNSTSLLSSLDKEVLSGNLATLSNAVPLKQGTALQAKGRRGKSKILLANIAHPNENACVRRRSSVQDIIFNIGGISNILWFMTLLHSQEDILKQHSSQCLASDYKNNLAMKLKLKACVDRQRHSIRLLHGLLINNTRNVKEMIDVGGYQLLARIIWKHHW